VPWGEGFGIPNRSSEPLVRRVGQDHPFPIFSGSPWRESDVARATGIEPHPAHVFPTAGRLRRLIVAFVSCRSAEREVDREKRESIFIDKQEVTEGR
jgi:hypothetical protein